MTTRLTRRRRPPSIAAIPTPHALARTRIEKWRRAQGMSQTELAKRIGRRQSWLSRYLAGEFETDLNTLNMLATVLDRPLVALFEMQPQSADPRLINLIELYKALDDVDKVILVRMAENLAHPPPRSAETADRLTLERQR